MYKAKLSDSDEYFALKRIKMDNEKEGVKYSLITWFKLVSHYSNKRNKDFKETESYHKA